MKLGAKILFLRKRDGLTQLDLANKLGTTIQEVYKWETDTALPDLNYVQKLSKLFKVSYSLLIDGEFEDTTDHSEDKADKVSTVSARRNVFYTGHFLDLNQADIDNGYVKERTTDTEEDFLSTLVERAKMQLTTLGATDILPLQPHSSTHYFYDDKNKVFGFYYEGEVQFVCPIEKLVAFSIVSDSITLTYSDIDSIKELHLSFSVDHRFFQNWVHDEDEYHSLIRHEKEMLYKSLQHLNLKLLTLKQIAAGVMKNPSLLPDIDFTFYRSMNENFKKYYLEYYEEMVKKAKSDRVWSIIRGIWIFFGIVLLGIIVFGFLF